MDPLALISDAIVCYSKPSQDNSKLKSKEFQNLLIDLPYSLNQEKQVLIALEATEYAIIKSLLKCYSYYLKRLMISTTNQPRIKNLIFELNKIQNSTNLRPNDSHSEEFIISGKNLMQTSNFLHLEMLNNDITIKYNNNSSTISESTNEFDLSKRAYIEITREIMKKGQVFSINGVHFMIISIDSQSIKINIIIHGSIESIELKDSAFVDKIEKGIYFSKENGRWAVECSSECASRLMLGVTNAYNDKITMSLQGSYIIRILEYRIRINLNPFNISLIS